MLLVTLNIQLGLIGPFLTQSTAIGSPGVDAPIAKKRNGIIYIPDSLIKGKLRESWAKINEIIEKFIDIDKLLGEESPRGSNEQPQRGRLIFSDFEYTGASRKPPLRYRIRMDTGRGAVAKGANMVLESPFAVGEEAFFQGKITYFANETEATQIKFAIDKGLRWITGIGAEHTIGFGSLVKVYIKEEYLKIMPVITSSSTSKSTVLYLKINIKDPFCIAKRRTVENIFESETVISGAVLRGAIASTLKSLAGLSTDAVINETTPEPWKMLGKYFNLIDISYAFPAKKSNDYRPVIPPQSLAKPSKGYLAQGWYDVALCESPGLINSYAPEFAIDWKDNSDVWQDFGWYEPKRELRVRTRIESETRRAKEHELFAYEMVIPDEHWWAARIDLTKIPENDRSEVETEIRTLLKYGIYYIGKTDAKADVELIPDLYPKFPSNPNPIVNRWVITLQTPALLCNPSMLEERSGSKELHNAYNEAWENISGNSLSLIRYFARQTLAGGYLHYRFQPGEQYNPFLLTEAGSVFILEATGDIAAAQKCIDNWLNHGLDLPQWAIDRYGTSWKTNPFLPCDGFGEIIVNLLCHQQKKPPEVIWENV